MSRNNRNFLIWEEGGEPLEVAPKIDSLDAEEVESIFEREIGFEVEDTGKTVLFEADVQITCESAGGDVSVFLLVFGEPPYTLRRNGDVIQQSLLPEDFPITDSPQGTGEFCYELESADSNADETCCTV